MKIALLPNLEKPFARDCIREIIQLLSKTGASLFMLKKEGLSAMEKEVCFVPSREKILDECDAIVTIGGDGTIIHEAKAAALARKPVLGINVGKMGFVAQLERNELYRLRELVEKRYSIEERMLLKVTGDKDLQQQDFHALNDVVFTKSASSNLVDLKIYAEGKLLRFFRADGVIVSTPTGSTAYSLSAGGPIVEPSMRCIIITPVCPHSFFSRSYVVPETTRLVIRASCGERRSAFMSIDGGAQVELQPTQAIEVLESKLKARFIQLEGNNFYSTLDYKLTMRSHEFSNSKYKE